MYSITSQFDEDSSFSCFFQNSNFSSVKFIHRQEWLVFQIHRQRSGLHLNPIEYAWSWMKMRLRESSATNIEEWKQDITRLWVTKMSENDYLQFLVTSMPRRMQSGDLHAQEDAGGPGEGGVHDPLLVHYCIINFC